MASLIRSPLLGDIPHAFLDAGQSDAEDFGLVAHQAVPVFVRQTHSAIVLAVDAPFTGEPPEADGLVTATPGLALAIRTADCAPVLLHDNKAGVVAAAHAGWRGAFGGVLEATLAAMAQLGATPATTTAAIGPTIAQPSYEVDKDFRDRFCADEPGNAAFFAAGAPGHFQFDLPHYVRHRLRRAGIAQCDDLALDTYSGESRFHSFRRATHRGEPTYGRQFSLIALPN